MTIFKELGSRFSSASINDPAELGNVYKMFLQIEGTVDRLHTKKKQIEQLGTLNERGISEQVRQFSASRTAPELRRAYHKLENSHASVEKRRANLGIPAVDRKDIAGVMDRQEIRKMIRELPPGERMAFVSKHLREVADAVLEKSSFASGLSDEHHSEIRGRAIKLLHADKLQRLDDEAEAIALADAAFDMAIKELQKAVGLETNRHAFDEWMNESTRAIDDEVAAGKRWSDYKIKRDDDLRPPPYPKKESD